MLLLCSCEVQVVQEWKVEGEGEGEGEEGQATMRQSNTCQRCFSLLHILVTLLT
jgi:hypothetical protein